MISRNLPLLSIITAVLMVSSAFAVFSPPMTENYEWEGRIVVFLSDDLGTINVESKDGLALLGNDKLDALAARFNVMNISKLIPWSEKPAESYKTDISRYYILEFPYEVDLHEVIGEYEKLPEIVTAEPYLIRKSDYIPSDTYFNTQWAMSKVGAEIAYDYTLGSSDLIIGIVDSGVDTLHDDLKANLWVNPGEDLNGNGIIEPMEWNGIDDDNNSFVDDFWGWNLWYNNNNIQDPPDGGHGTHCSGDANAVTDNVVGIASLGCSAKIMPARVGNELIYAGTQGISYCIENGANVISMSYGGPGYSAYEQNIITNGYLDGVLFFGSAGNDGNSAIHYPSCYNDVINVAATDQNDHKAGFSNYGTMIDICAPGVDIFSTMVGNIYQSTQGTSMSTPIAAGLALMIWAADPTMTNEAVEYQIYFTCVNIDDLNPGYAGLLGWGRIDAGAAISSMFPNLAISDNSFDDSAGNGDGRPDPGETVDLLVTVENASLSVGANSVELTLECDDPDVTIINGTNSLGDIPQSSTVNNHSDPLQFTIDPLSYAHDVTFTLTMHEPVYDITLVEEIVQMIGRPPIVIISDDEESTYHTWYDQDLRALGVQPDVWDVYENGAITDTELALYPIVFWHTSNADDPISAGEETLITDFLNNGGQLLLIGENIDEQMAGSSFYSDVLHASSTSGTTGLQVTGIDGDPITNGFTMLLFGAGGAQNSQSPATIDALDDASLIFEYIPSGDGAGIRWSGANSDLVYLPFCLEAVSGIGSTTREEIITSILNWFDFVPVTDHGSSTRAPEDYNLGQNYPNPFNPTTEIAFSLPSSGIVKLSVFDLSGRKVASLLDTHLPAGSYTQTFNGASLASGIYIYRLESENFSETRKMVILK